MLLSTFARTQSVIYALTEETVPVQLVTLDPVTATTTVIGEIAGTSGFGLAYSAFDTGRDHFIFIGKNEKFDNALFSVRADNAFVMYAPEIDGEFSKLQYNCNDGKLYAVESDTGIYKIVSLDPITGEAVSVSVLPEGMEIAGHSTSIDEFLNAYLVFCDDLIGDHYLLRIDLVTGMIDTVREITKIYDLQFRCTDGLFYGVQFGPEDLIYISLNAVTGDTVQFNALTEVGGLAYNENVLLEPEMQYVQTFLSWVGGGWHTYLGTIDMNTAELVSLIEMDESITAFETSFSCVEEPLTLSTNSSQELRIYPNPVHENMQVKFPFPMHSDFNIIITDNTGRQIEADVIKFPDKLQISTDAFPQGFYTVRLFGEAVDQSGYFLKF